LITFSTLEKIALSNQYLNLQKELDLHPALVSLVRESDLLVRSVNCGAYDTAKILVKAGANANQTDSFGETALMIAVKRYHFSLVACLLEHGAEISSCCGERKFLFQTVLAYSDNKDNKWFHLFALYKDRFNAEDLSIYHAHRLSVLYA
jgi:ankyrin repeat protein